MNSAPPADQAGLVLRLTAHPLQRCGARAVAALAGCAGPAEVADPDLDSVAGRLADDMARAAVAAKGSAAYDWWKVLFALYPNSPPTHSSRSKDPAVLRPKFAALFGPDKPGSAAKPCVFCGQLAAAVWGKDRLPMFDSTKALNSLPPQTLGSPGLPCVPDRDVGAALRRVADGGFGQRAEQR